MGNHENQGIKSPWGNRVTWANQIKILKQQFEALGAVIGGGLINAIKPFVIAMNSALKGIISFAEQVVNALGKIFGWVIEITPTDMAIDDAMVDVLEDQESGLGDVADAADDTAKSIEKAKEAEEEYQRTVLGFDELNKLNKEKEKEEKDPTSPSSGNSAIANPLKNLDLGKASAGAGEVAMSIKKVKSLYESEIDSLYELGGYISDTLTKALNNINWKDVYEGARGFGTGLASFLNGLITPDLFGALGKTIANSLNTALEFLNSFGNEFDFKNFGKALKSGLDELLKNFNWGLAKETARTWAKGMAEGLNEIINPETFSEIGRTIGEGLNTALAFLDEFAYTFDFKNLGDSIETGLNTLMETVDWKTAYSAADGWGTGLAEFLNSLITPTLFDNVGTTVANTLNTALHFLDSFGTTFNWENFGTSLATGVNSFLDGFDWTLLGKSINTWVNGVFTSIQEFLSKVSWDKLFDGVKTTLSQISFAEVGANIIATLWAGLTGKAMPEEVKTKVLSSFSGLESALRNISSFTFGTVEDFYNNFLVPVGTWALGTGLPKLASILKSTLEKISWDKLATGLSGLYTGLSQLTIGIGDGLIKFVEGLANFPGLKELLNGLAEGLENLFGSGLTEDQSAAIHNVGEALGFALGSIVAAKLTSSVVTNIKNLSAAEALPGLLTAITTHPVAAVVGGGVALAAALTGLYVAANKPECDEKIANAAQAIKDLGDELANTDIDVEGNYARIKEILDKYMELNSKLLTNGELSGTDQTMFEYYATELATYCPDILGPMGEIGKAYTGSKEALEQLLEKQKEQILQTAYTESLQKAYDLYVESELALEELTKGFDGELEAAARAAIETYNFQKSTDQLYGDMLELSDEQFATLFDNYVASLHGAGDETVTSTQLFKTFAAAMKDQGVKKMWDDYALSVDTAQASMQEAQSKIDTLEYKLKAMALTGTVSVQTLTHDSGTLKTAMSEDIKSVSAVVDHEGSVVIPGHMLTMKERMKSGAKDAVVAAGQGMQEGKPTFEASVKENVTDPAETGVAGIATVYNEAGKESSQAFANGAEENKPVVTASSQAVANAAETPIKEVKVNLNTDGQNAATAVGDGMESKVEEVKGKSSTVAGAVEEPFVVLKANAVSIGEETSRNYATGLSNEESTVTQTADDIGAATYGTLNPKGDLRGSGTSAAVKALNEGTHLMVREDMVGAVDGELGIENGSSSVMSKRGEAAIKGMKDGATTEEPNLFQKFLDLPKTLTEKLGKVDETFKPYGEDTIEGMETGEKNTVNSLETIFMKLPTRLGHQMTDLQSTFESIGKNIINYIKNGIGDVEKNLYTKITEIKDALDDPFDQAHYNKWWGIGHDTMDTMWHGLENMRPTLVQEITLIKDSLFTPFGQDVYNRFWRIGHDLMDSLKNGMQAVHIPVPHYSVSEIFGGIVGGKRVNVPSINVSWYKSGGMAYGPSVIGVGEAGNEAVLPLENQGVMAEIAGAIVSGMIDSGALANAVTRGMVAAGQNNDRPVVVNATLRTENDEILARAVARGQRQLDYRMNPVAQI